MRGHEPFFVGTERIFIALFSATSLPFGPSIGLPLEPPVMGRLWWINRRLVASPGIMNMSVIAVTMPTDRLGVA